MLLSSNIPFSIAENFDLVNAWFFLDNLSKLAPLDSVATYLADLEEAFDLIELMKAADEAIASPGAPTSSTALPSGEDHGVAASQDPN